MWKKGEEACASRLEWVEKSVWWDKSFSMNEGKCIDGGEIYNVVVLETVALRKRQ